MTGTTRQNIFKLKRSNVSGKIPTTSQLLVGEMAVNTQDGFLYTSISDTGGTNTIEVRQIGWDRLSTISGGTVNGDVTINGDLTVTGNTNLQNISIVNLTATTINPVDYIQFNTNYTGNTIVEGRMYWDEPNGTISLGMHGSNVLQQIGLEYYYYVKNQSGATIENGRVVRAAGVLGASSRILGEYMIADGSIPSKYTLGIATEDIVNGDDGYVTEFGVVRNINTTGSLYGETWNDGDILWVSPTIAGGLTKVEPSSPNLKIEMAIVLDASTNGSIFVRPNRYPSIRDLQDVKVSGTSDLSLIQYNSSLGYWISTNTPSLVSVSANTIYGTTFSGGTFYGDGSNLTGINDYYVTGGTYSSGTLTLDRQNGSVVVTGFTNGVDTYVTGFTYNDANKITISQNNGQTDLIVYINTMTGLTVGGTLSATTLYGDGGNVTNVGLRTKSNEVSAGVFTGNPKKTTVVFTTDFVDTNYSITLLGGDSRAWSYENKTVSGFTINSNANSSLTQPVLWTAIKHGEY